MIQEEIGKGTVAQVAYLGALGRLLPNFLDVNLNPANTESLAPYTVLPARRAQPTTDRWATRNCQTFRWCTPATEIRTCLARMRRTSPVDHSAGD